MAGTILIVEDESSIAFNIEYALKQDAFGSVWCSTCAEARARLNAETYSLVILDVGLPDGSGFDLCREIRRSSSLPIIMLTARADEVDRVVGLELGADDYVVKPFSPRELTARVKTILRRIEAQPQSQARAEAQASGFAVDENRCVISFCGIDLPLSRYEFLILKVLIAHPGWVYSREKLMELVWDDPAMSTDRTVDAHIKSIRAKLRGVRPDLDPIRTHRGLGYSLAET